MNSELVEPFRAKRKAAEAFRTRPAVRLVHFRDAAGWEGWLPEVTLTIERDEYGRDHGMIHCPYCGRWHEHSIGPGLVTSHCLDYRESYILVTPPEVTK